MASVGVNGAAAASLNERFIKCGGCKVNVPKEDMLALGKCTVCGRGYAPEASGDAVVVETVAFAGDGATPSATATASAADKPKRKRWMELKSKRGRTYYHNVDTGEDTWEKPVDIDADAVGSDGFVPFKNDAVKNAVLREQAKLDATKMGLPAEVIATLQQKQLQELQEQEASDPFNKMLQRPAQNATPAPSHAEREASPKASKPTLAGIPDVDDHENEAMETGEHDERRESTPKQGSCVVM